MNNYHQLGGVTLPPASGLYANMMPFIMGDMESLPPQYRGYRDVIEACPVDDEFGKVGYLTIDERAVRAGDSHRRGGVHTEGFGNIGWGNWGMGLRADSGPMGIPLEEEKKGGDWGGGRGSWGGGSWGGRGGLYMANSLDDTCMIYDVAVLDSGPLGEVYPEQIAGVESVAMPANTLFWIHDRTPHESLPLAADSPRQFFRLVTNAVSVWYADHSTPNPLGVQPAARIIQGSKFS